MIFDCIGKAIFLFLVYNIVTILLFGVPRSLSETFYLYQKKHDNLKVLFPLTIVLLAIFLMPCWLTLSDGSDYQFLSFLSSMALTFVGASPAFDEDHLENTIHNVSAYICAICALLWIVLVTHFWYLILISFVIVAILAVLTKTWRTCYIYWLEIGVFLSTFSSIILYYITNK
jgi:hypothetical protein